MQFLFLSNCHCQLCFTSTFIRYLISNFDSQFNFLSIRSEMACLDTTFCWVPFSDWFCPYQASIVECSARHIIIMNCGFPIDGQTFTNHSLVFSLAYDVWLNLFCTSFEFEKALPEWMKICDDIWKIKRGRLNSMLILPLRQKSWISKIGLSPHFL